MNEELLWIFRKLPDHYVVLDTETTGLPTKTQTPDIVSLGLAIVKQRQVVEAVEFSIKPQQQITREAESIHGFTNAEATKFDLFENQWPRISEYLKREVIVIHNSAFDWPILIEHLQRYKLEMPKYEGVFCSQKAAFPWAIATGIQYSERGPSLDTLTSYFQVDDLRQMSEGKHGAKIDSLQTAHVIEKLREMALAH